jgi:hypothetical protein
LRSNPFFENSKIILVPESNYAFEAGRLFTELKRVFGGLIDCIRETHRGYHENSYGFRTDAELKKNMTQTFNTALSNKRVHFYKNFEHTIVDEIDTDNNIASKIKPMGMKELIMKQLPTFCYHYIAGKKQEDLPKITIHGKHAG